MEPDTLTREEQDWASGSRMHPLLGFAISTVFVIMVLYVSPRFVLFLVPRHPVLFEIVSRGLPLVLIAIGYFVLVRFAERLPNRFDDAIALPLQRRPLRDFVIGAVVAAIMVTASVIAIALAGEFSVRTVFNSMTARRTVLILCMTLVAALLEEVMFRGYPFQRLVLGLRDISAYWLPRTMNPEALERRRETIGKVGAVLIFSALFGAIHLGNPNASALGFINTIAIGVTLAIAYFRTDALWMPFGLHFGWNFVLGVVFGLPVSGLTIFATVVHGKAVGPKWLTGGAYGIEASATGTAVILLATVVLYYWRGTRESRSSERLHELPLAGIQ